MTKKNRSNFTFRVIKNGKTINRCQTHSKRRFYNRIRRIDWQNKPLDVYLRVSYGYGQDVFAKMVSFYNDGFYKTRKELLKALTAFSEKP